VIYLNPNLSQAYFWRGNSRIYAGNVSPEQVCNDWNKALSLGFNDSRLQDLLKEHCN